MSRPVVDRIKALIAASNHRLLSLADIEEESASAQAENTFFAKFLGKLTVVNFIAEILGSLRKKAIDEIGGVDEAVKLAGELFDTYVAPIDIPWVPNIVETYVLDPALRRGLLVIVREAYDRLDDDPDELAADKLAAADQPTDVV